MVMNKALWVFFFLEAAVALLFGLAFNVTMLYFITVAQLNPLQLVLVGTTIEATIFLFEIPTGVVADVFSRRLSVIVGYFLIGAAFLLEGSLPVFGFILLSQVVWGIGYTFTSGATQAWITDEIGEEAAGHAFLRASQIANIAALIGIPLSVLIGLARVNVPILVSGACLLLMAVVLILIMPETGFKPVPRQERSTWHQMARTFRDGLGMVRRRPVLRTILGIGLFYGLYSEGFDRLWLKHLLDDIGLPSIIALQPVVWVGIINAGGLLLSIGAVEFLNRRLDTRDGQTIGRIIFGSSLVLITSLIAFALIRSFLPAVLLLFAIDIARSITNPLYTTWVNQRLDSQVRATVLSLSSQMDAVGQITTGPVVGVVGRTVSVTAAIGLTGLILSPVLLLLRRAIHQENTEPDPVLAETIP